MNNKSKNIFLGFLFTLLILVSITSISATDTNSTSTQTDVQDVATQTIEPVEKVTSTQVTKTQEKTDKKLLNYFTNVNPNSKNRSIQPEIQLCAPVCFDGANIEFFMREMS